MINSHIINPRERLAKGSEHLELIDSVAQTYAKNETITARKYIIMVNKEKQLTYHGVHLLVLYI